MKWIREVPNSCRKPAVTASYRGADEEGPGNRRLVRAKQDAQRVALASAAFISELSHIFQNSR